MALINADNSTKVKELLTNAGLQWNDEAKEFQWSACFAVQFLVANEPSGKASPTRVPEPLGELNVEEIDGLPVVRLSRLIEMKIACGAGNIRRTHKDFADVVELIAVRKLEGSFVRYLHKTVRATFRELRKNAHG